MNITRSLAKSLCDKNKTVLFFCSCSRDLADLVKERYFIATNHAKIYRTKDYVYLSSSNLSLSSWDEITVKLKRTEELDKFINEIKQNLKVKNDFIREFY
jgi:predicted choloylglycine hydrolase